MSGSSYKGSKILTSHPRIEIQLCSLTRVLCYSTPQTLIANEREELIFQIRRVILICDKATLISS